MAHSRIGGLVVLSLILVLATSQSGRSDDSKPTKPVSSPPISFPPPNDPKPTKPVSSPPISFPPPPPQSGIPVPVIPMQADQPAAKGDSTCKIYSLGGWSDDPNFGKWIADTIPEVIQPGTWRRSGGKNVLSYNAPTGILVVYHTPVAQAQVDAFLKNVKRSLPQGKERTAKTFSTKDPLLVPAKYSPVDVFKNSESAPSKATTYPVPAQAKQPKHLFHFIIRYEGEGIIDSTVAGVLKQLYGTEEQSEDPKPGKKKKKKSVTPAAGSGQTSAPVLDQLFHLIVRYEGDGIIDSTVAEVLKAMYGGQNSGNSSGLSLPTTPMTLPNSPSYGVPATNSPGTPTAPSPPKTQTPSSRAPVSY